MSTRDVVLAHPVRTAIGTYNGTLKDTPAIELGAAVVRETVRRASLDPTKIGSVVMGNVIQAGNKMNPARQAAIDGGIPVEVPAMTVNRVCGSGAQAIAIGRAGDQARPCRCRDRRRHGEHGSRAVPDAGGRWGYRMGNAEIYDSMLRDGLNDAFSGEHSGWHTEDLVTQHQITREDQDRWALRSQQRFAAAQAAGKFAAEIVAGRGQRPQGAAALRQGRAQPSGHHGREPRQAEAGLPQGRHDHRRQCARPQQRRRGDDRRRARLGLSANGPRADGAAGRLGRRQRSSRACSASGRCRRCSRRSRAPAGRSRDVERVEINEAFAAIAARRHARARAARGHRQRRGRRHRARPSDRRDRRGADDAATALDAARRSQARRRDPVHRRRPRDRAGARDSLKDQSHSHENRTEGHYEQDSARYGRLVRHRRSHGGAAREGWLQGLRHQQTGSTRRASDRSRCWPST